MATQQVEDVNMETGTHNKEDIVTSTGSGGSATITERYPVNAVIGHADCATAPPKSSIRLDPRYSDTSSSTKSLPQEEEETKVSFGVPALTESVSSGDIDELDEEDHLSSNGPSTPAVVLASLYQSQGSSTQASAPMSSAPSSNLTSSASSATAASESNAVGMAKHRQDGNIMVIPAPSALTSASMPAHQEIQASQVPKRQRIPRACDSCRRKKIRCNLSTSNDSNEPEKEQACANCHQSGIHCTFTKSPAKRGPNKGYIQQLETRLAALESSVASDLPGESASSVPEASQSRTARTHSLIAPSGLASDYASQYALPTQKQARHSDTLPPQHIPRHPLHIPSTTLPFATHTATNETWSRTTAPPTLHSSNSFFLSSADAYPNRHQYPQYPPPTCHPADSASFHPKKSTLPPISSLISSLPTPDKHSWPQQDISYADSQSSSSSRYPYPDPHHDNHAGSMPSYSRPRHEDDHSNHRPRKVPSRQPSYSNAPQFTDLHPQHRNSTSPKSVHSEYSRDTALLQSHPKRAQYPPYETTRAGGSPSTGSPAALQQSISDYSPRTHETGLRWPAPAAPSANSRNLNKPNTSLLSRLDRSAVLSLDSPAFRRAVFETPAMRTFSILPPSLLEEGFQGCSHLIKAAHLLSTSSATLSYAGDVLDDSQWQSDSSAVIGECMVPMKFDSSGSDMTCREIESLMMCYVDALRRGKLIAGILGAISGKLAILETRGLPCKRYQAVGILLAVWHTVGYSSRRMYFGTPSTSGPDALYNALDTKDPTILAICIFTYNLDKMCRRYSQSGETYVAPESIEFNRVLAASFPEPLPKAQLKLLTILDSFLLVLNFAYNQSLTSLPTLEALERQRHHLHSIVNDADGSDVLNLLVGPHVLAMVACATLYCLAACREKGQAETDAEQKQNLRTLERDYLSILDALRNLTISLSATPESYLVNSHPFADGGDMRLLYGQIAKFVKVNLAAAISSGKEPQLSASHFIGNLHSLGYLGTMLAASQDTESVATSDK